MTEPTTEHWRDLHMSFREFCLATPWQWLDDTDVLAIEHPSGEYTGYCTVLGSAGQEYGLALFVGDEGLSGYMALMTDEVEPESMDAFVRMNALSAILADREDMDAPDRAIIRRLGLPQVQGKGQVAPLSNLDSGIRSVVPRCGAGCLPHDGNQKRHGHSVEDGEWRAGPIFRF